MGAPALLWQALQVAFRVLPTVANEVADPIVTVFVTVASGSIPLLTVNVTLQVPALVTEREVACPAAGVEQPAVPAPDRLQVYVSGATPEVTLPLRVMLLPGTPLILAEGTFAALFPTVNPMFEARNVKSAPLGF